MAEGYFYGTGRRKSAVARVFMKRGAGAIVVNGKLTRERLPVAEGDEVLVGSAFLLVFSEDVYKAAWQW